MAVRVIGSWYYTSELPRQEAANLRAAMITKNCESLETWLKTSVHDSDRKTRLYALLRHAAFESSKELFRKVLSFWAPVWD